MDSRPTLPSPSQGAQEKALVREPSRRVDCPSPRAGVRLSLCSRTCALTRCFFAPLQTLPSRKQRCFWGPPQRNGRTLRGKAIGATQRAGTYVACHKLAAPPTFPWFSGTKSLLSRLLSTPPSEAGPPGLPEPAMVPVQSAACLRSSAEPPKADPHVGTGPS